LLIVEESVFMTKNRIQILKEKMLSQPRYVSILHYADCVNKQFH
jgi:hypothetical protein